MKLHERMFRKLLMKWYEIKSYFIIRDWFDMGTSTRRLSSFNGVSICVGIKDRSDMLLNYLIPSINNCNNREYIQLSIYDCGSTDIVDLWAEVIKTYKGNLVFSSQNEKFTRTHSFNGAVAQSTKPILFICDADMTIPVDFVDQITKAVDINTVWFPICFSLFENKEQKIHKDNGWWRTAGYGIMGISKYIWSSIGGYDECFTTWGGEDDDMLNRIMNIGYKIRIVRNKSIGLFHNWHPYEGFGGVQDKTTVTQKIMSLISN
jgi:hypothetical protein